MRLNYKRTFFTGLAFLSICAFWQMYDNVIPLMLKNTFHLGETITGFLMGLDNILALFMLPMFGALSDKADTRLGKRTPFILTGTILAVISMSFIPIANRMKNLTMFLIFLGMVLLAMGSYRSPAVALMPDITPKPLRSKANAIINLMGALGGVYTLAMIILLVDKQKEDYTKVFIAVAGIMVLAVILLMLTVQEKKIALELRQSEEESNPTEDEGVVTSDQSKNGMPKEVKKSFIFILSSIFLWFFAYNAVTTAYSRYAEVVWGLKGGGFANALLVATIAAIFSYIPIGFISSKVGRKKTIIAGIIMMTASYLCGALFVHYSSWVYVVFAFTGIGWAAINVNSYPMVVEMCKGADIGKYTGVYYIFSMSSQIITPIVSGALLEHVSYRTLFPYAVIFSAASFCTMLFVKHGDSKPVKKKDMLENFDTQD
ncbi:MFS transporter [Lachnospiraceae bacterium MD1]|uniref:MFS transporter n=1 Tax=Variimorphobacter saccharofermentans TaxID=2755051 RepID=A0A839JY90_9FIRM|nr:MFS transporter [Variimorphobacter saccharofermentans]MBB2182635.1 MFS transporter [Variimorphobacter saccharofermentans]